MSAPPWVSSNPSQNHAVNYDYNNTNNHNNQSHDNSHEEHYGISLPSNPNSKKEHKISSIIGAAAIAGTAAGVAIAGPVIGLVGGVAAATLATQDTKAGNVARSTGETLLSANDEIRNIDKKLGVMDKLKLGLGSLFFKVKASEEDCVEEDYRREFSDGQTERDGNNNETYENGGEGFASKLGFITNKFNNKDATSSTHAPSPDLQRTVQDEQYSIDVNNHQNNNNGWSITGNNNGNRSSTIKTLSSITNQFKKKPDCNYTPWPDRD